MPRKGLPKAILDAIKANPHLVYKNGIVRQKQIPIDKLREMGVTEDKAILFKLSRLAIFVDPDNPKITVESRDGQWKGDLPMEELHRVLFGDDLKLYVMAAAQKVPARIIIFHVLPPETQNW